MTKGQKVDLAIFAGLLVTACCLLIVLVIVTTAPSNPVYRGDETSALPSAKAVYFVQSPGQLATSELQAHPEVIVTNTVSDFKQHAQTKVALWIDKNTTALINDINDGWLDRAPQMYYPIVLVGYGEPYSFKLELWICCFGGPAPTTFDWSTKMLEPGFSVIQRQGTNGMISDTPFLQGYNQTPHVQDILNVTNALIEGTLKPTATTIVTVSTPTLPPIKP